MEMNGLNKKNKNDLYPLIQRLFCAKIGRLCFRFRPSQSTTFPTKVTFWWLGGGNETHSQFPSPSNSHSVGASPAGSTRDGSLLADFFFVFFLTLFVGIEAANSCSGSLVYSRAYPCLAGCSGLGDLDCSSTDSESIASASSCSSIELEELEDNLSRFCCKLACKSLFNSTD